MASAAIQTSGLFSLPAEIRLRIYELILVTWLYAPTDVGNIPVKTAVFVNETTSRRCMLHIDSTMLRVCKQVYAEAVRVLYSMNSFSTLSPTYMLQFLKTIGPDNVQRISTMKLMVGGGLEGLTSWQELLAFLSANATGLRALEVAWECHLYHLPGHGTTTTSMGNNIDFVFGLRAIKNLDRLVVRGFYNLKILDFLKEKMQVPITAYYGFAREDWPVSEGKEHRWQAEHNAMERKKFDAFQECKVEGL